MSIASHIARQCLEFTADGVLILDHNLMVSWINPALAEMFNISSDELVGKTAEFITQPEINLLFTAEGVVHLTARQNSTERWLKCRVTQDPESDTCIRIFTDVTELFALKNENQHLRQQIEELSITDELTGLANRRALTRALNAQVTRSRRYQNPLCLTQLELLDTNAPGETIANELVLATSRFLRDRLRWVDVIARWDHSQFIIILPETTLDSGYELLNKVREDFSSISLPEGYSNTHLVLKIGVAEWKKGFDGPRLMTAANKALAENMEQAAN